MRSTSSLAQTQLYDLHVPSSKLGLYFLQEGEDPVSGIINELREAGARVKYGVDASALRKGLKVPAPRRCQQTRLSCVM